MKMQGDNVAWDESDRLEREWRERIVKETTQLAIGNFVAKYRKGIPTEVSALAGGAFNGLFRLKYEDGGSIVIRFTKPGRSMFPDEKTRNEVATLKYIRDHTSIPVPTILHWGTKDENPLGLGPFIIMEYIDYEMSMPSALNTPGFSPENHPVLNPNIEEGRLEMLYRQVADILLQLSKLEFPLIGALGDMDERSLEVTRRPLSMPMNELVRTGNLPRANLPTCTFNTTSDYTESLAKLHIDHLTHQRNDAIESKTNCQRKYVARHLFHNLASKGKLLSEEYNKGPFKLWCDDLRPCNILLDKDLQVVSVIDWEFSYAAPAEYTFAPPWWLLLEQPEYWNGGLDDWIEKYEQHLTTFLKVMTCCEDDAISTNTLQEEQRLSDKMRESWANGDFWAVYAARKSFAFDSVYWKKLDPRFFEAARDVKAEDIWMKRFGLLDETTRGLRLWDRLW